MPVVKWRHDANVLFVLGTVVFEVRQPSLIGLEEELTLQDPEFKSHSNQPLVFLKVAYCTYVLY